MTTSATPIATREGLYRCTGIGETKFFDAGKPLNPGGCPGCKNGTAFWLYSVNDDQDRDELVRVTIDLGSFQRGLYFWVDDLFSPGDQLNVFVNTDLELDALVHGCYEIVNNSEEGGEFHFWANRVGHNYFNPEVPLYEARPHPE